ncbi:hypothetical protein ACFQMM_16830 [Saliphagus sp. GCM10025308]
MALDGRQVDRVPIAGLTDRRIVENDQSPGRECLLVGLVVCHLGAESRRGVERRRFEEVDSRGEAVVRRNSAVDDRGRKRSRPEIDDGDGFVRVARTASIAVFTTVIVPVVVFTNVTVPIAVSIGISHRPGRRLTRQQLRTPRQEGASTDRSTDKRASIHVTIH